MRLGGRPPCCGGVARFRRRTWSEIWVKLRQQQEVTVAEVMPMLGSAAAAEVLREKLRQLVHKVLKQ